RVGLVDGRVPGTRADKWMLVHASSFSVSCICLLEPIHPSRLNLLVEETRREPRRESGLAQERRMICADLQSFFDSVSQHEVGNNRPPKKFPVGKTSIQYRHTVIHLKAATTLGLDDPPTLPARADVCPNVQIKAQHAFIRAARWRSGRKLQRTVRAADNKRALADPEAKRLTAAAAL